MRKKLLELGFKELPHRAIGNPLVYYIEKKYGKTRIISISDIETPNEIMAIGELKRGSKTEYEDIVFVHNYDYDGYISIERIKSLLFAMTGEKKFNSKK